MITPFGAWIDARDADILVDIKEDVWCFRTRSFISIHTVMYLNPNADEVRRIENVSIAVS